LRWQSLAVPLLGLSLSACVGMSRSQAVAPLAADWAQDSHVESIALDPAGLKVRPEFDAIFRQRVKAKLDGCARGARPLRLEARLERLDKAHPLTTLLVGGANVLRGSARLVDVATGQVVGDYKVGKTIVGSRFAILVMSEAEEQLSDAFGDELCKQAFAPAR
jgi:hypothetical protein